MMITKIKEGLLKYPLIYRLYHRRNEWQSRQKFAARQMDMVYKWPDLTAEYYERIKSVGDRELEHQIGRLTNWKTIINECQRLPGHFIEFGTYRGFSLIWIAYFLERAALFDRQIIGLDSFSGLPYADGTFRRGSFGDNSLRLCRRNVLGHRQLYDAIKKKISIEQCFFQEHERMIRLLRNKAADKFCFIHIDCDVSQSFIEIFSFLSKYDLIAPRAYVLFDDYGQKTNLAQAIERQFGQVEEEWEISTHSATKFTRNYFFKKKCIM